MKIVVYDRERLMRHALNPFPARTAIVCIAAPAEPFALLVHEPDYRMQVAFEDLTPEEACLRAHIPLEQLDHSLVPEQTLNNRGYHLLDDALADAIAAFVLSHRADTELLIFQCRYGISRSAACAAATAEFLFGTGQDFFDDCRYSPNPFVYEKLLAALKRQ